MIRLPQYFIAIFCFLLIAACDDMDKVSPALDRAQALQDDHADSALAILDSLRIEDMEDDAIRARYALMKICKGKSPAAHRRRQQSNRYRRGLL